MHTELVFHAEAEPLGPSDDMTVPMIGRSEVVESRRAGKPDRMFA